MTALANIAFWSMVARLAANLSHQAIGQELPASMLAGPPVWGFVGSTVYGTGTREAPNGTGFEPLFSLDSDFNLSLLPNKQLYLFAKSGLWIQRNGFGDPGTSAREVDFNTGLAWNYFDALEIRAAAYSGNNLNQGSSLTRPSGYTDGYKIENRYYFASTDPYDVGRLSFVSLGYDPTKTMVGNNGQSFKPGAVAEAYLTRDLPTPFRSYLYGDLQLAAQSPVTPRLLDADLGLAIRPLDDWQSLEFRLGNKLSEDFQGGGARDLVYAAVRINFGLGGAAAWANDGTANEPGLSSTFRPEVWGVAGLPVYATGSRIAPNGASFTPIFGLTSDFNLGLLPHKELYLFWDGIFWGQHSGAGITNASQGAFDFSRRELDSELGLAWNYLDSWELRTSGYMLNNLNRVISPGTDDTDKEGIKIENRYYFDTATPYDVGRLSFVGLGYMPVSSLVGNNGAGFDAGLFAHASLTCDLPPTWLNSYVYGDLQVFSQNIVTPRLLNADVGLAVRPFSGLQNIEFRLGSTVSDDVRGGAVRTTPYGAVRISY